MGIHADCQKSKMGAKPLLWFVLTICLQLASQNEDGGFTADDQRQLDKLDEIFSQNENLLERLVCHDQAEQSTCLQYILFDEISDEAVAIKWLSVLNDTFIRSGHARGAASFRNKINITKYNQKFDQAMSLKRERIGMQFRNQGLKFITNNFRDDVKRQFYLLLRGGVTANEDDQKLFGEITSNMESIYSTSTVCVNRYSPESVKEKVRSGKLKRCLQLEPDLQDILATSRDEEELLWVWLEWRNAVGPGIGQYYPLYVNLTNDAAVNGGYRDRSEILLEKYEQDDFEEYVLELWEDVRPMYLELHTYVRRKLQMFYGTDVVPEHMDTIPAHLLGNMWAQQWDNIYDLVMPYPDVEVADVTRAMNDQHYTVHRMFTTAETFFKSIGLDPMPQTFWEKSMFERPKDPKREVACHGSASDGEIDLDVRIKMCTEINQEDLQTVHHEMGHVEYYLMYRPQPIIFREGANPGFHEAVGDTIALSVVTPDYLHQIGLLDNPETSYKADINYLMKTALNKIAFLPYGLLIDQWRWKVFRGEITPDQYNEKWWELREYYQGVHPPVMRHSYDFDPGAKYHISSRTPYIRYFVSFLIQFQFHRALCEEAGSRVDLHKCNIYKSKEAGAKLRKMLEMGISRPWQDAMEVLTSKRYIDTSAIKEYFRPLREWLATENLREGVDW